MRRLLEWTFRDTVQITTRIPDNLDAWDLYCPLMSLPRAFQTRVDTIPAQMPLLQVPDAARAAWAARLQAALPGKKRVGIAWAGRASHK